MIAGLSPWPEFADIEDEIEDRRMDETNHIGHNSYNGRYD
jgi:hypothetical protein